LFDPTRKRALPYPPQKIGLITSGESAAYHDFVKILNERWGGVEVVLADVQVQGEAAPAQIVSAIEYFNSHQEDVEVLVVTRGGGSADDLTAFSTEQVTRAIAASRIPTIVAIGHEVDVSLAELAADQRASTPSNAAQLLVPDKRHVRESVQATRGTLNQLLGQVVKDAQRQLVARAEDMRDIVSRSIERSQERLVLQRQLLYAFNPEGVLKRGYAIVHINGAIITSKDGVKAGDELQVQLRDGIVKATAED
jgi:exodeoxyribonuclease VII large subunit